MKVDGITLLQMIKDGKIKDNTKITIYYLGVPTKHVLLYSKGELGWKPGEFLVGDLCREDYSFEILEEKPKEIEKVIIEYDNKEEVCKLAYANSCYELNPQEIIMLDKIEELRKAVNYLLKKEDE